MMVVTFIGLIVLAAIIVILMIKLNPAFGGSLTEEQKQAFSKYDHFEYGRFVNPEPTSMSFSLSDMVSLLRDAAKRHVDHRPNRKLLAIELDWNKVASEEDSVTWFGHSSILVSMDNKKILIDPVLGLRTSPISIAGSKRYTGSLLSVIDDMSMIDAIFITHDHYDHLDYSSIKKLKEKTAHFFVPLGVSNHLIRWGIPKEKITELNWWDETEFQGLKVAFTPSRHFSGRGLLNRNSTLWGGWVIIGGRTRFYTSGDGGYGRHFKEIGEKYGPFDLALIEGGQYDRRWAQIHMTPEESVQAHTEIKGETMMLIHWGAFTLAYHRWTDPIERAIHAAGEANIDLMTPQIGETVPMKGTAFHPVTPWWVRFVGQQS
jgi:L-ascorbate metabolism protein UlaG (beta-lactamase superfamily)